MSSFLNSGTLIVIIALFTFYSTPTLPADLVHFFLSEPCPRAFFPSERSVLFSCFLCDFPIFEEVGGGGGEGCFLVSDKVGFLAQDCLSKSNIFLKRRKKICLNKHSIMFNTKSLNTTTKSNLISKPMCYTSQNPDNLPLMTHLPLFLTAAPRFSGLANRSSEILYR